MLVFIHFAYWADALFSNPTFGELLHSLNNEPYFAYWTFGELLHSLNNEPLKNKIRNIEKLNKKSVNIKNGIDSMKHV